MNNRARADRPRVSIVVPCFNSGAVVSEAVESALSQTYRDVDVVVVDDGSTDQETTSALAGIAAKDRVTLVRQENQGSSAARNVGIRASTADFILPLDADDLISPRYVEEALSVFSDSPDVRIVYCRADLFGSRAGPWELPDFSWPLILVHNVIFASCVFRKDDWAQVGGYDPSFVHGREDHDFLLKLLGLGGRPERLDGTYFHYRQSVDSRNSTFGRSREQLIDASARLLRNSPQLYVDHAEDLFRYIFGQQDVINDFRHRYRLFEVLRRRFPRVVRLVRAPVRYATRLRRVGA